MVCVSPTVTVPKASLAWLGDNWPSVAPVPESERLATASAASLAIVSVALKFPVVGGANVRLKLALWPAARVAGRLGEVSEKYLLEIAVLLIVIDALPAFVALMVRVL